MDILNCFRKSKRNTSPTSIHDTKRTSIFRIFRKKLYSSICEDDLDNTNRDKSITLEQSSDKNHSTEEEKTQNRQMPPETIEVQKNPALHIIEICNNSAIVQETAQDKITKSLKTSAVQNVTPNAFELNKDADGLPKPTLYDTNSVKQLQAQMQPNLNIIDFSNINPKTLTSRFVNNLEPCIRYQGREKYLHDLTNIELPFENYRNISQLFKLDDEYVTVEISSRLITFDSSESSSDETMSLRENVKPSIPPLNSIPTSGKNARQRRKKKNKMKNAACDSTVFNGVYYSPAYLDKTSTAGAHLDVPQSGQPIINNFLSTKTGQPIIKKTLPTTSGQPMVKVPVAITGKTSGDTLLSSRIRLEGFPFNYQQNKTLPSVAMPLTSTGAQPRGIAPLTAQPVVKPIKTSQNSIFPQSQVGQITAKVPGATGTVLLVANQKKTNVGNLLKEQPVRNFPIAAPATPSTSSNTQNSKSKARFECTSLEKVHGAGFLMNRSVMVPNRNWNCLTGNKTEMYCEFCNCKFPKNHMYTHIKTSTHLKKLQECPVLGDFGQALIRKMNSNRFHCAICNVTFTKEFIVNHVQSHTSMYEAAVQQAKAILCSNTSIQKLEKITVTHNDENFTNKPNKTAPRPQESERLNSTSNVSNAVKKNFTASSQETVDKSKSLVITSLQKVHGEGFIINKAVLISVRSYNALSGSCAVRFCNVCQRDAEGANGFVHVFMKEHTDNMKKYQYLQDRGLHLFRKIPNDNFYCSICAEVISNAKAHYVSAEHCQQFAKSSKKAEQILSHQSKYKIVSL